MPVGLRLPVLIGTPVGEGVLMLVGDAVQLPEAVSECVCVGVHTRDGVKDRGWVVDAVLVMVRVPPGDRVNVAE